MQWGEAPAFGCFRKDVFDRVGLFDEDLVRNQDNEFNLRIIKRGGTMLLSPKITCYYYARDSLGKLWRMFYQYGYFKPLVARKLGAVMTARQLAPPALVVGLLLSAALAAWKPLFAGALAALAGCYLLAVAGAAAGVARRHGPRCGLAMFRVFPAMHFAYGLGYLRGILNFVIRRKNSAGDSQVVITR